MTCRDTLQCVHEPFGDAWYFGPERLSDRYEKDEKARIKTGFSNATFKTIFDEIEHGNTKEKRLFIKDMAQYWMPLDGKPSSIAPSLVNYKRGVGTNGEAALREGHLQLDVQPAADSKAVKNHDYPYDTFAEPNNPTVIPEALLTQFHFTFLIRHPSSSIPSYYRCTVPPLDKMTGFYSFDPLEAGYSELRKLFDYLRKVGQVGPHIAGKANDTNDVSNGTDKVDICLIDADDLLDNPYGIIEAYCKSVGIPYSPQMLKWDSEENQQLAKAIFEKWPGFHEDAIHSDELRPRTHKKTRKSEEELYNEWSEKFGEEGAKVIQQTVRDNVDHYEYLKQFALKV